MTRPQPEPQIKLGEVALRRAQPDDAERVLDYHVRNRVHLEPWSPRRPPAFYSLAFWTEAIHLNQADFVQGRSVHTFLFDAVDQTVLGALNLTNLVRGAFQACNLGYAVDAQRQGQGLMGRAVEAIVDYAFEHLQLHRVMANYIPSNERSARLLARRGFVREGFAQHYLLIDGRWQDHVLTARTNPAWTARPD